MSVRTRTEKLPKRVAALLSEIPRSVPRSQVLSEAVGDLDPQYATEVLTAAWSLSLCAVDPQLAALRPSVKRLLAEISNVANGTSRSAGALADALQLAQDTHEDALDLVNGVVDERLSGRGIHFEVSGQRLQSTQFARDLHGSGYEEALRFLAGKAAGGPFALHKIVAVNEFAARIDEVPGSQKLWRSLFLRTVLLVTIARQYPRLARVPERACILPRGLWTQSFFDGFFKGSMVFDQDEIGELLCFNPNSGNSDADIVTRPVFDVGDGFVTSSALLLDSIAPLVLQWTYENGAWQQVISRPFEDSVVKLVGGKGFQVGPVSEAGFWSPQGPAGGLGKSLALNGSRCPGEMDVLASDGVALMLLECKSVYPFANPRNTAGRVSQHEDIDGWIRNAEDKVAWLEEASGMRVELAAIVVEGIRFLDTNQRGRRVVVTDIESLSSVLG